MTSPRVAHGQLSDALRVPRRLSLQMSASLRATQVPRSMTGGPGRAAQLAGTTAAKARAWRRTDWPTLWYTPSGGRTGCAGASAAAAWWADGLCGSERFCSAWRAGCAGGRAVQVSAAAAWRSLARLDGLQGRVLAWACGPALLARESWQAPPSDPMATWDPRGMAHPRACPGVQKRGTERARAGRRRQRQRQRQREQRRGDSWGSGRGRRAAPAGGRSVAAGSGRTSGARSPGAGPQAL